jgi:hypothetical protein
MYLCTMNERALFYNLYGLFLEKRSSSNITYTDFYARSPLLVGQELHFLTFLGCWGRRRRACQAGVDFMKPFQPKLTNTT